MDQVQSQKFPKLNPSFFKKGHESLGSFYY